MKIVLIGPPGSGKGTLAQGLEKKFGLKHLSMGQLIRQEARTNPILAHEIDSGNLADDETTQMILKHRLSKPDCQVGFILDGYPRSLSQAQNLAKLTQIDYVFLLEVSSETIKNRILSRLSCPNCNAVYNKSFYNQSTCERCGSLLEVRGDDNEQSIENRIKIYNQNILPIVDLYKDKIVRVDVNGAPEEALMFVSKVLERGE